MSLVITNQMVRQRKDCQSNILIMFVKVNVCQLSSDTTYMMIRHRSINHSPCNTFSLQELSHVYIFFFSLTMFCLCPLSMIPLKTLIVGSHQGFKQSESTPCGAFQSSNVLKTLQLLVIKLPIICSHGFFLLLSSLYQSCFVCSISSR